MNRRKVGLVAVVLLVGGGLCAGFLLAMSSMLSSVLGGSTSSGCGTDGAQGPALPVGATSIHGLSERQLANADAVIAEGRRRNVPAQGVVVALATASQESHFRNYANDGRGGDLSFFQLGVSRSLALPHEAVGSDHGSLGIFQQQWPWWGSMTDLMDPSRSAGKFYQALLRIPGWERMPVTVAAQAVQHSAFPDAYADDEVLARKLLGLASTQHAVSAGVSPGSGSCTAASAVLGTVTFPLPSGAPYVDRHNFGGHGSHWARMHTGTDLSVSCGTPVLAATAGRIVIRTDQSWAGRWLVQVSTGPGQLTTWYAHMQAVTVSTGQQVAAGQQIGEVGDLGNATGCHLHFEVHPHGGHIYQDPVDPSPWLRANVGRRSQTVAPADWASSAAAFTVATFNTLGSSHTEATGKKPRLASGVARTRGVIELLDKYGVDVVGLQEFQRPQQRAFRTQAGDTFATWAPSGDPENSIAWRRDRWDLVAVDSFSIPYFDGHPRRMPIVRLRDRSTGREALFVNVHNPADTRRYPHQARWRAAAVGREVTLVRRLERSTGIPVFLTGDLNDRRTGPCGLVGRASMTASNGAACTLPRAAGIDWILGSDAVQFGNHTADSSALVKATSDHPFVVTRARTAY